MADAHAHAHTHDHAHHHPAFIDLHARAFSDFREVTGPTRPSGPSACALAQVLPGLYIGKYQEIKEPDAFSKTQISPPVGLVVNAGAANDQCPTKTGFYGPDVLVLRIELLDEPNAGDAKQYFRPINANIRAVIRSGKSVVVHCAGSISRASTLVIAYLMEIKYLSAVEAATALKKVWDATWPCDAFVEQLFAFEKELIAAERLITGPKRPPGTHGCQLVELIPGIVNVHFNDINQPDSIAKINASGKVSRPITLVVNSSVANKQCDTYQGFYGPDVELLPIDLFDDPKDGGMPAKPSRPCSVDL
jgi:protein-tyrosine phosphatase